MLSPPLLFSSCSASPALYVLYHHLEVVSTIYFTSLENLKKEVFEKRNQTHPKVSISFQIK